MEVSNRMLSFFWNNFDFLVRFIYCRVPFINKMMFWNLYSSDFKSLDRTFEKMLFILKENDVQIKATTALELGPGNSYIMAYNFLMHGVKKIYLVDKFPRTISTKKQGKYFDEEVKYIKNKYRIDSFFINERLLNPNYLDYFPKELKETNLENVDIIYSNSVLEHIKDYNENIAVMSRILKPGGYMCHNIDLRDHYNFNAPFLFYKYEDSTWNKYLTKVGVSYTNRLRYDNFIQLFKKYGFEMIHLETEKRPLNQKKVSSKFQGKNKKALEITKMRVLMRKVM